MVLLGLFNLILHHGEEIITISNVDPNKYFYVDLINDVLNEMLKSDEGIRVSIELYFTLYGETKMKPITLDVDMLKMFRLNDMATKVNIYANLTHVNTIAIKHNPIFYKKPKSLLIMKMCMIDVMKILKLITMKMYMVYHLLLMKMLI